MLTTEQLKLLEDIQKELHEYSEWVKKEKPHIEYQDVVTIFMLLKIAELQKEIGHIRSANAVYR